MFFSSLSASLLFPLIFIQFPIIERWNNIYKFLITLSLFTALLFAQRICILTFARNFHKHSYENSINSSQKALRVLNTLRSKNFGGRKMLSGTTLSSVIDIDSPSGRVNSYIATSLVSSSEVSNNLKEFFIGHVWNSDNEDLLGDRKAEQLAREIYKALSILGPITSHSFSTYFSKAEDVQYAFKLFDVENKTEFITESDMKLAVVSIFRERRRLMRSLVDINDALSSLNSIMYLFTIVITFFLSLPILGISLSAVVPAVSLLLTLSFVFGGSASTAFNCMMFLFVSHPFDSGDRVHIEKESYIVESFNLLNTVLVRHDGHKIYAPNGFPLCLI